MFFKKKDLGRLYVIKIITDNGPIYKIGMCRNSRSTDRMMEILRSWFVKFRYVPRSELKLDKETGHPRELEYHIHKILKHKKYEPEYKVEGHTEMFHDIDENKVIRFIKQCRDEEFENCIKLTDKQYRALGNIVSP